MSGTGAAGHGGSRVFNTIKRKYMRTAVPDRTPIVLIHGMASGPSAWGPVVPLLERTRTVHVLTLPGHAGERAPYGLTSEMYIDAVEAELDRLGIRAADIVGNSLGGWIALQLAARGRARSVVCLAPAGGWPVNGAFDRYLTTQFAAAYRACRMLIAPGLGGIRHSRPVKRALLRAMVAHPELVSDQAFEHVVRDVATCSALAISTRRAAARDLSTVPEAVCPVLIAWSARDRILVSRRYQRRLAKQVGAPVVMRLPDVGHVPMSDAPDLVADTILSFTATATTTTAQPGPVPASL